MNFVKKGALTAVFTSLVFTFACGNNTPRPASTATDPATPVAEVVEGLQFTGKADVAQVSILIADNYLSQVVDGNPYPAPTVQPSCNSVTSTSKVEIKITSFTYYGNGVDVTCKKDLPPNSLNFLLYGSTASGQYGLYAFCDEGFYFFTGNNQFSFLQGPNDEITQIKLVANSTPTFSCEGSDGNEYVTTMYPTYQSSTWNIESVFETNTKVFTGVISVVLRNSGDVPRNIFFE